MYKKKRRENKAKKAKIRAPTGTILGPLDQKSVVLPTEQ
jgi:hypothetical protein